MALPLVPAIIAGLTAWIVPAIVMVLASIGISIVVVGGMGLAMDALETLVQAEASAVISYSLEVAAALRVMRIDQAVSLILSAYVTRWTIKGVAGGALTAWRLGG